MYSDRVGILSYLYTFRYVNVSTFCLPVDIMILQIGAKPNLETKNVENRRLKRYAEPIGIYVFVDL